ncbi:hypothetical protein D6817_02140 [Candidatus Pacearchaeota archaeon]|nr:MAG: hypothetical protein D6817_02140 [Candidatus Pacearchaeota archaeon]
MEDSKKLLIVAIIALVVSMLSAWVSYLSVSTLSSKISGFASNTGEANLTVESSAAVNFTTDFIDWGSGQVDVGQTYAQLTTLETNNVTNGNWTLQTAGGLRIENIGNVNVSLNLSVGKTAAQFIGGTNPGYQWNVTAVEANACLNSTGGTGGLQLGTFIDTTTSQTEFCPIFQFVNTADEVRIDLNITVPYNAPPGAKTDTITATVTVV